jgi:PTS system mannitol-specific IIA component
MSEIVTKDLITASGAATTREQAIREARNLLLKADAVTPAYVEAMQQRERSISTYMGSYLAIPHGTNNSKQAIRHSAVSLVRYASPIDWGGNEVRAVHYTSLHDADHKVVLTDVARRDPAAGRLGRDGAGSTRCPFADLSWGVDARAEDPIRPPLVEQDYRENDSRDGGHDFQGVVA